MEVKLKLGCKATGIVGLVLPKGKSNCARGIDSKESKPIKPEEKEQSRQESVK